MGDPLISIVTPSYNQADFLRENIRSIQDQPVNDVEHIVVDGASNDETVSLLREKETEYNLRWVSEPDRGQSHALNKGIEMANGRWIGWQNSDDFYLPEAFDRFEEARSSYPTADAIYGDIIIVDGNGRTVDHAYHIPPSKFVQRYANIMANQALFVRRGVFDQVGTINEEFDYAMDIELFWRLTHSDLQLLHVPEFLGVFRTYEEAKTGGLRTAEQQAERESIQLMYGIPWYERILPKPVLRFSALTVKASYLLAEGRIEAFRQPLNRVEPLSHDHE